MHCNMDFPPANPADDNVYTIDFINEWADGITISNASATLTVFQGTDASPSSHLVGPAFITAPTFASQQIRGLVAGNIYSLNIIAVSSDGFQYELYALLPCQAVYS